MVLFTGAAAGIGTIGVMMKIKLMVGTHTTRTRGSKPKAVRTLLPGSMCRVILLQGAKVQAFQATHTSSIDGSGSRLVFSGRIA